MSPDLSTRYLGLTLRSPLVASASPLSGSLDSLRRLESAGAGAVVMQSLFEEQVEHDETQLHAALEAGAESYAEAITFFPELDGYNSGPAAYLAHLEAAKRALSIPVIGSLNGHSAGGWTRYARLMQEAGADAVELNAYFVATDPDQDAADVEERYLELVANVRAAISVPLAVKLGPYFTSLPNLAGRMVEVGADGLVLFNRFLHPDLDLDRLDLVFTAIEADEAHKLEPRLAQQLPVISTASAFRMEPDVPIFVSTINAGHAKLIDCQRKNRGWKGFITPQPNCTTIGLATTLKPVYDRWGLNLVLMTSMQAMSGAGRQGGVLGLDILDNVVPYIPKEEEKVQQETQKVLGRLTQGGIEPASFPVSCTCTRVNVMDGHTEAVFVSTRAPASVGDVKAAFRDYRSGLEDFDLPSAPDHLLNVLEDPFRPQPRLDRDAEGGMATSIGRVRQDPALPNGVKWVLVSHNTKMGAAKGAVLVGELLSRAGYIG